MPDQQLEGRLGPHGGELAARAAGRRVAGLAVVGVQGDPRQGLDGEVTTRRARPDRVGQDQARRRVDAVDLQRFARRRRPGAARRWRRRPARASRRRPTGRSSIATGGRSRRRPPRPGRARRAAPTPCARTPSRRSGAGCRRGRSRRGGDRVIGRPAEELLGCGGAGGTVSKPRSSSVAAPSSYTESVTSSAASWTTSTAWPMATPRPAQRSISMSLRPSPIASTSAGVDAELGGDLRETGRLGDALRREVEPGGPADDVVGAVQPELARPARRSRRRWRRGRG